MVSGDFVPLASVKLGHKSMVKAFRLIDNNPSKKVGSGAVICLAKARLPLTEHVWVLPVTMI